MIMGFEREEVVWYGGEDDADLLLYFLFVLFLLCSLPLIIIVFVCQGRGKRKRSGQVKGYLTKKTETWLMRVSVCFGSVFW